MAKMNRFVIEAGGIPTMTWLDGMSDGEQRMEALIEIGKSSGAAALNIIPDRNYTPGVKDRRLQNLNDVVALAEKHQLPIIVGTEMNAPGRNSSTCSHSAELKPLAPAFLRGACIFYAHSVLQRECGLGYLSAWASRSFSSLAAKNDFFAAAGRVLSPGAENSLSALDAAITPAELMERLR